MMQRDRGKPIDMLFSIYLKRAMFAVIALLFWTAPGFAQSQAAPDEENCLICHRYPAIGRYDENGIKRVYYINDQMFLNSVHGKLRCKSCHVDLDKIPHENVKKVDCATSRSPHRILISLTREWWGNIRKACMARVRLIRKSFPRIFPHAPTVTATAFTPLIPAIGAKARS